MNNIWLLLLVIAAVSYGVYRSRSKRAKSTGSNDITAGGRWYTAQVAGVNDQNDDGSPRRDVLSKCRVGETILLVRGHDTQDGIQNAVIKVCRTTGEQIGFITEDFSGNVVRAIDDEKKNPRARILEINSREDSCDCVIEINFV